MQIALLVLFGQYQLSAIRKNLLNLLHFVHPEVSISKSSCHLEMFRWCCLCQLASRRIFWEGTVKSSALIRLSTYINIYMYCNIILFLYFVFPCHAHIGSIHGPVCDRMLHEESNTYTFVFFINHDGFSPAEAFNSCCNSIVALASKISIAAQHKNCALFHKSVKLST